MSAADASSHPRSWAEIDRSAFLANVECCRSLAPGGRLLAVLKADAYGHGAPALARAASTGGVAGIGVGDSTEALELRAAGITVPILVLGALVAGEIPEVVRHGIVPVVHSLGRLRELESEARRQGRVLPVHLKVDTGMGRLGMLPSRVRDVARRIRSSPGLALLGLMSHLAGHGEAGAAGNRAQAEAFRTMIEDLRGEGLLPPDVHLRSSAGLLDRDLVVPGETLGRAGALLFGFDPAGQRRPEGLRPVLSLRTQICFLKDVPEGTPVGYDGTFVTTRHRTRLAVIPLGYHDGVRRELSGRGSVLLRGRRAPIVGRISMDYTTLDITEIPGAVIGDVVTLIGEDSGVELSAEEVASTAGTIPYELLSTLGRRVRRVVVDVPAEREQGA